jgi:ATP synthase protein I
MVIYWTCFLKETVNKKPDNAQKGYRQIALATTIPLIMLAAPAVGYFIGRYIDKLLGTSGIMAVVFLLMGVAAGGVETYRLIKEINKEDS